MSEPGLPPSPYPGLRAFRGEESAIFCGRVEHRAELLRSLRKVRFLAVVGASGSGKSSLVLAGLLPDIRDGLLIGVDPDTVRIASLQPGLRPFANLAESLARELGGNADIEQALRRGPLGLVQLLDEIENAPDQALMLVIDQFEEIFRFADLTEEDLVREDRSYATQPLLDGTQNEAQAFINLILATAQQSRHPVYVLLTMRSDFFARCDEFTGLPEAISRSQFLTPRLNREQLEQAITRPLRQYGASIQPELVNSILNQISSEQDQLPLMQHALSQTWYYKKSQASGSIELTVEDYLAVGGMASALDRHGNDLCEALRKDSGISLGDVERFFRCLFHHVSPGIPPVRRPARVAQIAHETGLSPQTVRLIADAFRAEGCHLLMPPTTKVRELKDDTFLDISHESLLRQWQRLKGWTAAEWRQRRLAEDLVAAMEDCREADANSGSGILSSFLNWRHAGQSVATRLYRDSRPLFFSKKSAPSLPIWAKRYGIDWPNLSAFCRRAFAWKRMTSVISKFGGALVVLTVILFVAYVRVAAKNEEIIAANKARDIEEQKATLATKKEQQGTYNAIAIVNNQKDDYASLLSSVRDLVKEVEGSSGDNAKIKALLARPEIGSVLGSDTAQTMSAPLGEGRPFVAGTASPIQFSIPADVAGKEPRVAYLWSDKDVELITGAFAEPTSLAWSLSRPTDPPRSLLFEALVLSSSADGRNVLAFGSTKQITLIGAGTNVSTSGDCEAVVRSARVIQVDPLQVLFGTEDGHIGLWNGRDGAKPLLFETGHPDNVSGVDYSPESRAVLASGDSGWARLWRLPGGTGPLTTLQMPNSATDFREKETIQRATFRPGGRSIVLPVFDTVAKLVSLDGTAVPLVHQSNVLSARFSRDGLMLATADDKGRIYLWNAGANAHAKAPPTPVMLVGHRAPLNVLLWSPNNDFLFSAGKDGIPIVWQRPQERLAGTFSDLPMLLPAHPGGVTDGAISPDGKVVSTVGVDKVLRCYPVRPCMRGKARGWGGPDDERNRNDGLALLGANDVDSPEFTGLFLPAQPPGTTGLIARLNPKAYYVNARWDYAFTPRSLLRSLKVRVRKLDADGKPTGPAIEAQPVDWGPPAKSGLAFDLSPAAMKALGLGQDDQVEMEIPLLEPKARPKSAL